MRVADGLVPSQIHFRGGLIAPSAEKRWILAKVVGDVANAAGRGIRSGDTLMRAKPKMQE